MKNISYLLLCVMMLLVTACEKDTMPATFAPEVTTGTATNIYRKGATLSGNVSFSGGTVAERYGILFSSLSSMAEYEELEVTDGNTDFSIQKQNLEPGKTYYFCSYAYSGYSMSKGEIRDFTTTQNNAPVFDIPVSMKQTANSLTVSVNLLDDGGSEMIMMGFCYNEVGAKEPTFMDGVINVDPSGTAFSAEITGLEPNKQYQVRAYGANENGLAYSEMIVLATSPTRVPTFSDVTVTSTSNFGMAYKVQITDIGTSDIIKAGLCRSTEKTEPTLEDIVYEYPLEYLIEDNYWMIMRSSNLTPNTTFYYRFFATNADGTGYSKVFVFTTPDDAGWESHITDLPTQDWE